MFLLLRSRAHGFRVGIPLLDAVSPPAEGFDDDIDFSCAKGEGQVIFFSKSPMKTMGKFQQSFDNFLKNLLT